MIDQRLLILDEQPGGRENVDEKDEISGRRHLEEREEGWYLST